MNILAATASDAVKDEVYHVAVGDRTTLNELFSVIKSALIGSSIDVEIVPVYREFRVGDVRHSQADVRKAKDNLGYDPKFNIVKGIEKAMPWYVKFLN